MIVRRKPDSGQPAEWMLLVNLFQKLFKIHRTTFFKNMLSNTLRQIEILAEEIKHTNPELYQHLLQNPIPIPAEFQERNNPTGLRDHLLFIEKYLAKQLEALQTALPEATM